MADKETVSRVYVRGSAEVYDNSALESLRKTLSIMFTNALSGIDVRVEKPKDFSEHPSFPYLDITVQVEKGPDSSKERLDGYRDVITSAVEAFPQFKEDLEEGHFVRIDVEYVERSSGIASRKVAILPRHRGPAPMAMKRPRRGRNN